MRPRPGVLKDEETEIGAPADDNRPAPDYSAGVGPTAGATGPQAGPSVVATPPEHATLACSPARRGDNGGVITGFGHAALTVTDLDASVEFATGVLGLRVMERRDGTVYLTAGGPHHAIEYRR